MALLEPPVETSSKTRHLKFIAGALVVVAAGGALFHVFGFTRSSGRCSDFSMRWLPGIQEGL